MESKGKYKALMPAWIVAARIPPQGNAGWERPTVDRTDLEANCSAVVKAEDEAGRCVAPALIELPHAALKVVQVDGICKIGLIGRVP
jgi:hypothetical protein